jgi:cytochrome P450
MFPDAETFNIDRYPNPHVAFGSGIHHCLGATLARLEGQEALKALAERFPSLYLGMGEDDVEYQPSITFRSIKELPVSWR